MALMKFKRSAVPAKVPSIVDLALGELAINTYDGKLFLKKNDGTESVVEIGAGGGGGSGTVTSVSGTGSVSGLTLSGTVTSAGSITLGGTLALTSGDITTGLGFTPATAAQGAKADTAVQTIASTDGSVTITGTTAIDLSVAVAGATSTVLLPVRNTTGATLTKGTAVYISGATGQLSTVSKAIATSDATSAQTLGLVTADISNNSNGNVTLIGTITDIDTSDYTDGQQLYLSPTTAGTLTATKPYAPSHMVYMAVVEHAHPTHGKLFVKVQNGYEMDELHDVSAQSPANNDGLFYNTSTSLWEKKSIATALGFTPYNATNPSGYLSTVSLTTNVTGTLPVANGGTGVTAVGAAGNVLTSDGTAWVSQLPASGGMTYTTVKTANFTASANTGVQTNTSGGAFTVTLPASPAVGAQVVVVDSANSWATNNLTIGRNGSTIEGDASDLICDISGVSVQLIYNGTTWDVFAQAGGAGGGTAGTLAVSDGGTGVSTLTGYVKGNGTSPFTASATIPTSDLTGTIPANNGGTGLTSAGATGNVLTSDGTGWTSTAPSTNMTTSGQQVITANTTLDSSNFGSNILVLTAGVTITFPSSSSIPAGTCVTLKNATNAPITLAYSFASDGPTTLGAGQSAMWIADGASSTYWRIYFDNCRELITTATPSAASEVVFTGLTSTYSYYEIVFETTSGAVSRCQLSTDNGSTWLTSGYYSNDTVFATSTVTQTSASSRPYIDLGGSSYAGIIQFLNPTSAEQLGSSIQSQTQALTTNTFRASGRHTLGGNNAIRLYPLSGTVTGTFKLYGIKA